MTLELLIKTKDYSMVTVKNVRSYYFGKNYIEVYIEDTTKQHFKLTTVLSIKEIK